MRKLLLVIASCALVGCASATPRFSDLTPEQQSHLVQAECEYRFSNLDKETCIEAMKVAHLFPEDQRLELEDSLTCMQDGAAYGTSEYAQCNAVRKLGRTQERATAAAENARRIAAWQSLQQAGAALQNSALALPTPTVSAPTVCRPIPYSAQNSPYGQTSYRCN